MMIGLINLTNVLPDHTVYHLDQTKKQTKKQKALIVSILNRSKGNSN